MPGKIAHRYTREDIEMPGNKTKIAVFIDGANLYATSKALGFVIDYNRLLETLRKQGQVVRVLYYTALAEDQEYSSIRPLVDWLGYNGYHVVTKPAKEYVDSLGRRRVKGSMDVDLAVDAMEIAEHVEEVYLFSGDGNFRRMVEAVQRKGVRVYVVSTRQTRPPMVADELRRQADQFIDLVEYMNSISRAPGERAARMEHQSEQCSNDVADVSDSTTEASV